MEGEPIPIPRTYQPLVVLYPSLFLVNPWLLEGVARDNYSCWVMGEVPASFDAIEATLPLDRNENEYAPNGIPSHPIPDLDLAKTHTS